MIITSLSNKTIKELVKLKTKKERDRQGQYLVDGYHMVNEAIEAGCAKMIITTDEHYQSDLNVLYVNQTVMEKLSFTIYGKSEDTAFCLETAEKFGLSPHVRDMGAQSRARFLAAQRSAQALIASAKDLEDFHSPLPLHLYEQILMQKPVIGIALGEGLDSELYQLIRECRLGFCYEQSEGAASFGALKKYLAESYLYYFTRAKELYEPNLKACARYAYGNLITLWKELLQDDSF